MGNALGRILHPARDAREALGGISRQTMWRLVSRGEIEVVRIGSRIYVEDSEIERFIDERRARVAQDDDGPGGSGPSVRTSAVKGGRRDEA